MPEKNGAVLVTGANGHLGRRLLRRLEGVRGCVAVVRSERARKQIEALELEPGAAAGLPDVAQVRLAGTRVAVQRQAGLRPVGPAVDPVDRHAVARGDQKVLAPQGRPVPEGFEYRSDNNPTFLTGDEILRLLDRADV